MEGDLYFPETLASVHKNTHTHTLSNTHTKKHTKKALGCSQVRRVEECNYSWKVEQEREQGGESLSLSCLPSLTL